MISVPGCLGCRKGQPHSQPHGHWQGHPSLTRGLSLAGPTAQSIPPRRLHALPAPCRTNGRGIFSLEKRHNIIE